MDNYIAHRTRDILHLTRCRKFPLRDKHADHAVLPGGDEQLAVAASADVQVRTRDFCAHGLIDELLQRNVQAFAAFVAHEELDFFDRCYGLGNTVIGFFHRRQVACEDAPRVDIAEYEFTAKLRDAAVVGEPIGYRSSFVVIVHRNRIDEAVLYAAVQNLRWQREQLIELAATNAAVLPDTLALHPSIVPAIVDDVDLLNVVHPDIGSEHRAVHWVPGQAVRVAEAVRINFAECIRVAVGGEFVRDRNSVITEALDAVRDRGAARIEAQDGGHDRIQPLRLARVACVGPAAIAEAMIAAARVAQTVIGVAGLGRWIDLSFA